MRKLILWIAFAAISGGALLAQNVTGTWQGALQPPQGPQLRIVIKISRADDESLKAVMYSIDQGAQPINATSISLQGSNLKMGNCGLGQRRGHWFARFWPSHRDCRRVLRQRMR